MPVRYVQHQEIHLEEIVFAACSLLYKMTIFSTAEEQQREPLEIGGKVLFYPDFALRTAGGDVNVVEPWKSYVLQDRELISGQNPFSDQALLNLLLPALDGKKKSVSAA